MSTPTRLLTRAEAWISRSALVDNLAALVRSAPPGTLFGPIIKANAYGHGRDLVATALQKEVELFTVAEPVDALALATIVPGRALCLGPAYGDELAELIRAGVRVAVTDARALPELGPDARVHLLVDTGLHRLGVAPAEAVELADAIRATGATLEGAFCHVAGADRDDWESVVREVGILRALPLGDVIRHTGGSGMVIVRPDLVGDLARPGVALFGHCPIPNQRELIDLRPAMTLVAPILELRTVAAGSPVGYSGVTVERETVVATLPIGVCHGLNPHWADDGGYVTVRNIRCPLLTKPMLDYTIVDVTDVPGVETGEIATILGDPSREGNDRAPSADATAARLGILPEHVLVGLHESIPRILTE